MTAPIDREDQLQWLVDRALIGDLLIAYARGADTKDWAGIAALFSEDGAVISPFGSFPGRQFAEIAAPLMTPFWATHHISTNHAIEIDGDRASSRSYLQATHLTDPGDPSIHADIGGWYDHTFVRIDGRWWIQTMELSFVWTAGVPFPEARPA
jgi:SnoaL-like domain